MKQEDEGTYACVASNIAAVTEERLQIIVLEKEEFNNYPNSQRYGNDEQQRSPDQNSNNNFYPDNYANAGQTDPYIPSDSRYNLNGDKVTPATGSSITLECDTISNSADLSIVWRREDK